MTDGLTALITSALAEPAHPAAHAVAKTIQSAHGPSVRAILFYGSNRRSRQPDGVLDFYVLVHGYRQYHRSFIRSLMNRILPPNVEYLRLTDPDTGAGIAAKVAVMSMDQFSRRMRPGSIDTTLWARFTQPATLLYAADDAARAQVIAALVQAAHTACLWARRLAPAATARDFWTQLFSLTYAAELRVERGRPQQIYGHDPDYYDAVLRLADPQQVSKLRFHPVAWAARRYTGKALSVLRLCKGAFTFEGGVDYLLWKVQRHSGVVVRLRPWQRRHPILAAPAVLYRLCRQRIIG